MPRKVIQAGKADARTTRANATTNSKAKEEGRDALTVGDVLNDQEVFGEEERALIETATNAMGAYLSTLRGQIDATRASVEAMFPSVPQPPFLSHLKVLQDAAQSPSFRRLTQSPALPLQALLSPPATAPATPSDQRSAGGRARARHMEDAAVEQTELLKRWVAGDPGLSDYNTAKAIAAHAAAKHPRGYRESTILDRMRAGEYGDHRQRRRKSHPPKGPNPLF